MLPWIIQMSIISLILIALVHYLFTFFKTNLTTPKIKDLVNKPQKQYEVLFDTMKETKPSIQSMPSSKTITEHENTNMKNELKNYLKELSETKKPTISTTTANINNNGGILTNENIIGNSFESNNYSTF